MGRILAAVVAIAFLHGLLVLFAWRFWIWSRVYKARREEREALSHRKRDT